MAYLSFGKSDSSAPPNAMGQIAYWPIPCSGMLRFSAVFGTTIRSLKLLTVGKEPNLVWSRFYQFVTKPIGFKLQFVVHQKFSLKQIHSPQ